MYERHVDQLFERAQLNSQVCASRTQLTCASAKRLVGPQTLGEPPARTWPTKSNSASGRCNSDSRMRIRLIGDTLMLVMPTAIA